MKYADFGIVFIPVYRYNEFSKENIGRKIGKQFLRKGKTTVEEHALRILWG